jgi:hypothetical protein
MLLREREREREKEREREFNNDPHLHPKTVFSEWDLVKKMSCC